MVGFLLLGRFSTVESQELDQTLLEKFKTEAPKAWERNETEYVKFFEDNNGWQVNSKSSGYFPDGKGGVREHDISTVTKRIGQQYGLQIDSRELEESAELFNKQYFSSLHRNRSDQSWVVQKIAKHTAITESDLKHEIENKLGPLFKNLIDSKPTLHPYGYFQFDPEPTAKRRTWFQLDGLKVSSIEEIEINQKSVIKVAINYKSRQLVVTGSNSYDFVETHENGSLIFDPSNDWCLLSAERVVGVDSKKQYRRSVDFEYAEINNVQFCVGEKVRNVSLANKMATSETNYQAEITVSRLQPSDFTINAFGLTDPDWYQPPRPWWLYSSLAGIGLLVGGALLLRYGKGLWNQNQ